MKGFVSTYGTVFWSEVLVGSRELLVIILPCGLDPAFS